MAINSKNMDSVETESFCSNSSSEFGNSCKPKDYTCSSLSNMKNNNGSLLENTNNNNSANGKIKLNFGVDRLLSNDSDDHAKSQISRNLLEKNIMFNINSGNNNNSRVTSELGLNLLQYPAIYNNSNQNFVLKPFPLRIGNNSQNGLDLHHHHHHQQQQRTHQHFLQSSNLRKMPISTSTTNNVFPFNTNAFTSMLRLPNSIATNQNPQFNIFNNQKYLSDASKMNSQISQQNCEAMNNNSNGVKRKRSWSRAVFSNLQRKGLERQFEVQKYITKPDRKKLAARLGLKDAQVKVWFQNRRMKWRNQGTKKLPNSGDLTNDLEKFTSDESSDEQDEIDVVSDK